MRRDAKPKLLLTARSKRKATIFENVLSSLHIAELNLRNAAVLGTFPVYIRTIQLQAYVYLHRTHAADRRVQWQVNAQPDPTKPALWANRSRSATAAHILTELNPPKKVTDTK